MLLVVSSEGFGCGATAGVCPSQPSWWCPLFLPPTEPLVCYMLILLVVCEYADGLSNHFSNPCNSSAVQCKTAPPPQHFLLSVCFVDAKVASALNDFVFVYVSPPRHTHQAKLKQVWFDEQGVKASSELKMLAPPNNMKGRMTNQR